MAIISEKKIFENTSEYICEIWGGIFEIYYESQNDFFLIFNDFKNECPKCKTPYNKPSHGDGIVCKCGASYEFYGALHPRPIGETRLEIEKALGWR
jgi:hypothetical protein